MLAVGMTHGKFIMHVINYFEIKIHNFNDIILC